MGVIKVDFKEVLESGIRRELVNKITYAMHEYLTFNPGTDSGTFKSFVGVYFNDSGDST